MNLKLVNYFILEGDYNSLIIDTGCGIGNMQEDVRRVTKKPLIVALTHGHFDHCGGMAHFDYCFMRNEDNDETTREYYLKATGFVI